MKFLLLQARKSLRRLKGIVRFQAVTQRHSVKKQASNTLSNIRAWSKIQGEIRARLLNMVMEGRLKQKKLEHQLKLEAKLHDLEVRNTLSFLFCSLSLDYHHHNYTILSH